MTAYRLAPRKTRRVWMGEDWAYSTILRDINNDVVDLTGATADLVIFQNGSAVLTADLYAATPTTGEVAGAFTAQTLYDALTPGIHQYFVRVRKNGITQVAEAGWVEYLGGAMSPDPEPVVVLIQGEDDDYVEAE